MNFKKLMNKVYENRADIAFVGGMILTTIGLGKTIVATHKNHDTIENYKDTIKALNEDFENEAISEEVFKEERKQLVKETVTTTAKVYAVPAGLYVAGEVMKLYSHRTQKILLKGAEMTIAGLTAKLVEEAKDHPLELPKPVDKNGNELVMTKVADRDFVFEYIFDETNPNFSKAPWANKMFLTQMENSWNAVFPQGAGYAVCEIIRSLGANPEVDFIDANVMTILPYKNDDGTFNHISFGLDHNDPMTHRFMMGLENSVKLRIKVV